MTDKKRFRVFATSGIGIRRKTVCASAATSSKSLSAPSAAKKTDHRRVKNCIDAVLAAALVLAVTPCVAQQPRPHDGQIQRQDCVEKIDMVKPFRSAGRRLASRSPPLTGHWARPKRRS